MVRIEIKDQIGDKYRYALFGEAIVAKVCLVAHTLKVLFIWYGADEVLIEDTIPPTDTKDGKGEIFRTNTIRNKWLSKAKYQIRKKVNSLYKYK